MQYAVSLLPVETPVKSGLAHARSPGDGATSAKEAVSSPEPVADRSHPIESSDAGQPRPSPTHTLCGAATTGRCSLDQSSARRHLPERGGTQPVVRLITHSR
jgi:hypothetical protein